MAPKKPTKKQLAKMFPGWTGEVRHVSELNTHPENPRRGNLGVIAQSIQTNGWFGALVVQESTDAIVVGNHRYRAGKAGGESMGVKTRDGEEPYAPMEWFPVYVRDVDDATARRILAIDNRANDLAGYDDAALAELLESIAAEPIGGEQDSGLLGTGFEQDDLDRLLAEVSAEEANDTPLLPTGQSIERYQTTDLRQVMLLMSADEYQALLTQFEKLMALHDLESNYRVVLWLLAFWRKNAGLKPAKTPTKGDLEVAGDPT